MERGAVHTTHPRYFGLFNPDIQPVSVAADALVAAFNPQLAAFSHNPAANLMEQHVLSVFRNRIGWPDCHATFTTGGSEANHSAIIVALTERVPGFAEKGATGKEVFYVSAEAHHSFIKIAHACGIGRSSVREIAVDTDLRMDPDALDAAITQDSDAGRIPFAVVATAGTTSAGAIDPLPAIAEICRANGLWMHVDAAWGGASLVSSKLEGLLAGIELADSVTIDAHKWFSVPMGAGMFFCRRNDAVHRAFGIQTSYMPDPSEAPDPYHSTLQWSRRFTGLKLFMAFATLGIEGYEQVIDHQVEMGVYLREQLQSHGFEVVNRTPLPITCFRVPDREPLAVVDYIQKDGSAWISRANISHHGQVLRACITNYRTERSHIDYLIKLLKACP